MSRFQWRSWPVLALVLVACAGCFPKTIVVRNPGPEDTGIRYYRPKPYLLVQPLTDDAGIPVGGYVRLETVTLPDFGEEYSIHIRSGLGTNQTSVKLEDGWNLTQINVDIDSQVDENLEGLAAIMEAVPGLTAGGKDGMRMVVRATNVPLGLYESVLSCGTDCRKRLYGFRYIGFLPYANCPVEMCGMEPQDCRAEPLYGLMMENAAMVFRPLGTAVEHTDLKPMPVLDPEELLPDMDMDPLVPASRPRRLPETDDRNHTTG